MSLVVILPGDVARRAVREIYANGLKFLCFWRTQILFVGPLMPLFWTSGDVCPGFQSQGGSLACVLSCLCDPQIHLCCDTCWLCRGHHGIQPFWSTYMQIMHPPMIVGATTQRCKPFDHSGSADLKILNLSNYNTHLDTRKFTLVGYHWDIYISDAHFSRYYYYYCEMATFNWLVSCVLLIHLQIFIFA